MSDRSFQLPLLHLHQPTATIARGGAVFHCCAKRVHLVVWSQCQPVNGVESVRDLRPWKRLSVRDAMLAPGPMLPVSHASIQSLGYW